MSLWELRVLNQANNYKVMKKKEISYNPANKYLKYVSENSSVSPQTYIKIR